MKINFRINLLPPSTRDNLNGTYCIYLMFTFLVLVTAVTVDTTI